VAGDELFLTALAEEGLGVVAWLYSISASELTVDGDMALRYQHYLTVPKPTPSRTTAPR
jgi:hypothetical protein